MIVNMGFVDMGADDIGVIALDEPLDQLTAQTVHFLRRDLAGDKGLPQMVGDHIILAAHSAGLLDPRSAAVEEMAQQNTALFQRKC